MKTVISIVFLVVCLSFPVLAAEFDTVKVKGVDGAVFRVGKENNPGLLMYIVDRTSGLCFASDARGLTKIECEPLKKIEAIKVYMETGKLP